MKYEIIRSDRKTLSLEIEKDLSIKVRAPERCPQKVIDSFVDSHRNWIARTIEKIGQREAIAEKYLVPEEKTDEYKALAKEIIPKKVEYWSKIMGLYPTGVKITSAEKRYGSCSGTNSLCFSFRLMAYPDDRIDCVVVHELAHIKHKNHGKEFYRLIEKYIPDYTEKEKLLKHKGEK